MIAWCPLRPRPRCRFALDARGSAAVEFSLIGPVLILLLVGVMEMASLLFAQWSLQSAAFDAARHGSIGREGAGADRRARIVEIVEARRFGTALIADLRVDIRVFDDLDALNAARTAADGRPGAGRADDYVLYFVEARWTPMTPLFSALLDPVPLSVRVPIRNEPF
ncbi:MAG: TadE/TadG family type IV pilus assembly protein [Paracoccaceae bacterium]